MIYSLVKMGLKSWLNVRFLAITILIFIIHSYLSFQLYGYKESIFETEILYFYGPQLTVIDMIRWLLHQFPIIMLTGLMIHLEFKERAVYIMYRVGSVHKWLFSLSTVIAIMVFVYYIIGFFITILFAITINSLDLNRVASLADLGFSKQNLIALSLLQTLLIAVMTLVIALSGILFALLLRNSILSLVLNIMFIILTISFKDLLPSLARWLIPAQGMLGFRLEHNLHFQSSTMYLLTVLLIVCLLLHVIVRKHVDSFITSENI